MLNNWLAVTWKSQPLTLGLIELMSMLLSATHSLPQTHSEEI